MVGLPYDEILCAHVSQTVLSAEIASIERNIPVATNMNNESRRRNWMESWLVTGKKEANSGASER